MKRRFNVTGLCNPDKDYMVDITSKMKQIKEMIDYGDYFMINRARQYGKTTILRRLRRFLADDYTVVSLSFEDWGDENFASSESFCQTFLEDISLAIETTNETSFFQEEWVDTTITNFKKLSHHVTKLCKGKKIVLMIDEVDRSSNNRIFLQFLGMLREKFLDREHNKGAAFQSVILAGVYDILRAFPWDIAAPFKVEMSFNTDEIATMLVSYENDYHTGMDITAISEEIYSYTSGYPFMVSRLCQIIHNDMDMKWNIYGVRSAVNILLREDNQLFRDMVINLENNKQLYDFMYAIIILRQRVSFTFDDPIMDMAHRYGYINFDNRYAVSVFNKIFETRVLYYFESKNVLSKLFQKTSVMYHNVACDD